MKGGFGLTHCVADSRMSGIRSGLTDANAEDLNPGLVRDERVFQGHPPPVPTIPLEVTLAPPQTEITVTGR
jgi:hypothetical protein